MAKNNRLIVRLTKTQYERVKANAIARGHKTISSYIRSLALGHDAIYEHKLEEIYQKIIINGEAAKKRVIRNEIPLTAFIED